MGLPHPLSRRRVCTPTLWSGGRAHSLAGEGLGGPNSDEGTYTVVLYIYKYFVLVSRMESYIYSMQTSLKLLFILQQ
jgi:hypothetical protein